jgi:acetyl esterase/lipase
MIRLASQFTFLVLMIFAMTALHAQQPDPTSKQTNGQSLRKARTGRPRSLPDTVTIERDIPYAGTTNPAQTLDLLLPRTPAADGPLPVIVNIHGGAFKMGDKSMGLEDVIPLVASGRYAAVTINYRLSGEAIWPAQIHDCKAAIRWVRANAGKYKLDAEHIGAIGASAGGHLVAMLGATAGHESLEGTVGPHTGIDSRVQCVVDQYGPTELLTMGGTHDDPNSPEADLIGGPVQEHKELARQASPITYVSPQLPPFLVIHGDQDPVVPFSQSEGLAAALKKAHIECYFVVVQGAEHGGFRNPEVGQRIRLFFDKHLRNQATEIPETAIPSSDT